MLRRGCEPRLEQGRANILARFRGCNSSLPLSCGKKFDQPTSHLSTSKQQGSRGLFPDPALVLTSHHSGTASGYWMCSVV